VIIIASEADDPTGQAILAALGRYGQPCALLDTSFFPQRDRIVYKTSDSGHLTRSYWLADEEIHLDAVSALLWRRPALPKASPSISNEQVRGYIDASAAEILSGLFEDLNCLQVPASRQVLKTAHAKLPQFGLAARTGFDLPDTLITNSPQEFLDFYRKHNGKIITKPAAVTVDSPAKGLMTGYARPVRPSDLVHFQDLQLCPLIVQVYVEKAVELRVTVVGSDVFAAEIHSQATQRTKIDWRRYDEGNTPHFEHTLPDKVSKLCLAMTHSLGLVYSAIDLILTPDGRYIFLELNPNGQYQWIEHLTGLPITDRIARLLIDHR